MIKEGPEAVKNPDNYDVRANIMWAGIMAHTCCYGDVSGSEKIQGFTELGQKDGKNIHRLMI